MGRVRDTVSVNESLFWFGDGLEIQCSEEKTQPLRFLLYSYVRPRFLDR
jgi:hypothetical protein